MEVIEKHWINVPTEIVRAYVPSEPHLQHFERAIREGVGPMDYVTNVKGQMTDFRHFNNDPVFHEYVGMFGEQLLSSNIFNDPNFTGINILDAWGNLLKPGESVTEHAHVAEGTDYATVIYFGPSQISAGDVTFNNLRGHVLTLPSSLRHSVPAAPDERMTLAFNWTMNVTPNKWKSENE
jgi:hypothetical protein